MRATDAQRSDKFRVVRELARRLMDENGLTRWEFQFNKNLVRSGLCRRKLGRPGRVELSAYFVSLNPMPVVIDTLKHEVAHAIVGPEHGHSEAWKAKCRELGCRPVACYGGDVVMPKGPYRAVCPNCKEGFHRHRRPTRDYHHAACGPERGKLVWVRVTPAGGEPDGSTPADPALSRRLTAPSQRPFGTEHRAFGHLHPQSCKPGDGCPRRRSG